MIKVCFILSSSQFSNVSESECGFLCWRREMCASFHITTYSLTLKLIENFVKRVLSYHITNTLKPATTTKYVIVCSKALKLIIKVCSCRLRASQVFLISVAISIQFIQSTIHDVVIPIIKLRFNLDKINQNRKLVIKSVELHFYERKYFSFWLN